MFYRSKLSERVYDRHFFLLPVITAGRDYDEKGNRELSLHFASEKAAALSPHYRLTLSSVGRIQTRPFETIIHRATTEHRRWQQLSRYREDGLLPSGKVFFHIVYAVSPRVVRGGVGIEGGKRTECYCRFREDCIDATVVISCTSYVTKRKYMYTVHDYRYRYTSLLIIYCGRI